MKEERTDGSQVFITTIDNPFDYFKQFDEWLAFDRQMGYYTLELLGRWALTTDQFGDAEFEDDLEIAIDEIIEWRGDLYKKIYS